MELRPETVQTIKLKLTLTRIISLVYIIPWQAEQIQAEFKVLALQHHPDKNSGDKDAEAKFQQLKVRLLRKLFADTTV